MMSAPNLVALVTGANRGLGFEISRQLAQQGITVLMGARKSDQGRVVNMDTGVASLTQLADPDSPLREDICPAYQTSKAALNALTLVFAKELSADCIKVNSACPGWVMTYMGHEDLPDYGDAARPKKVLTHQFGWQRSRTMVRRVDSIRIAN